jgi:hypothetical protein
VTPPATGRRAEPAAGVIFCAPGVRKTLSPGSPGLSWARCFPKGNPMKTIAKVVVLGAFAFATSAYAQPTPEQQRLSDCNAEANKQKVLKFSERKPFVDACMRGQTPKKAAASKKPTKTASAKQEKTQVCNKQASDRKLKGDDRKKYMNQCMKA